MSKDEPLLLLAGPTTVSHDVLHSMIKPVIGHRGDGFHELMSSIEEKLKKVFGTENPVVVLTASGTGGIEASLVSFLRRGEKLVVPVYGAFGDRLASAAASLGIDVARYEIDWGKAPSLEFVENALEENPDVVALAMVYNETSTGVTVRGLDRFSELAKRHGALFMVDAISIAGGDELEVDSWGIDVCIAGAQKCLGLPPVVSMVSVSDTALEKGKKGEISSTYLDLIRHVNYLNNRKETPNTPAIPLFYALEAGLDRILKEGLKSRYRRHRICAEAFYTAFDEMGLEALAEEGARSNVVVAMKYPSGVSDGDFRGRLKEKFGVAVAGGQAELKGRIFRVGSMGEISATKVVRGVLSISQCLNELGYTNDTSAALSAAQDRLTTL